MLRKVSHNFTFCTYYHTYYQILQVPNDATLEEIKKSYYNLAKKHHPDSGKINDEEFIKIKEAYETLKNPSTRSQYDQQILYTSTKMKGQNFYYTQDEYSSEQQEQALHYQRILFEAVKLGLSLCFGYALYLYMEPMTMHEIRRQNIILANVRIDNGPSAIERRKQQYMQQMIDKKIISNVVTLKVSNGMRESTKARNSRKNSMASIPGVHKKILPDFQDLRGRPEYI